MSTVEFVSNKKFILKQGSMLQEMKRYENSVTKQVKEIRSELVIKNKLEDNEMLSDHIFDSMHKVSTFINGGNINAWTSFKNEKGISIDVLSRV